MDLHGSGNLHHFKFRFNSSELLERLIGRRFDMTDCMMAGLARRGICADIKGAGGTAVT